MTFYVISKDGLPLWSGEGNDPVDALLAYRQELGAEAFEYDDVDPDWMNELQVDERSDAHAED